MKKIEIVITAGGIAVEAVFEDTALAALISDNLPLSGNASTWGEEIYFTVPVKAEIQKPVEYVEKGDIAYWPQGPAFCIFFGETPISSGGKIIPAGPVEVIGRVSSGFEALAEIKAGSGITVENKGA